MYLPVARREGVTIREMSEETLLYDNRTNKVHCLNPTSALVWRHCDGNHTITELAVRVRNELGVAEPEAVVQLALEQLSGRNLLERPIMPSAGLARLARRDLLKKLVVAGSLPLVLTITARAARAQGASHGACSITCNFSAAGALTGFTPLVSCPAGKECSASCSGAGPAGGSTTVTGTCV